MDRACAYARDVFEINPSGEEPHDRDVSTGANTVSRGKIPAVLGTRHLASTRLRRVFLSLFQVSYLIQVSVFNYFL